MLSAIELLVGLPRITLVIGAVAPTARPRDVFAKADAAAARSKERRERGF